MLQSICGDLTCYTKWDKMSRKYQQSQKQLLLNLSLYKYCHIKTCHKILIYMIRTEGIAFNKIYRLLIVSYPKSYNQTKQIRTVKWSRIDGRTLTDRCVKPKLSADCFSPGELWYQCIQKTGCAALLSMKLWRYTTIQRLIYTYVFVSSKVWTFSFVYVIHIYIWKVHPVH